MQNVVAIGCFVVLLLVGIPFAIKYPWRVAMVVSFFAAHIAVMVGYAVLIERLTGSQHPAARRFVAAHAAVAALLADHDLPDGPRYGKGTRIVAQTVIYLSVFVLYGWLLLSLGDVLDWLEAPPRDEG